MIFELHHGLLAFVGMDLTNDDLARAGYLADRKGRTQKVIGVGVVPVFFQRAIAVGFAEFGARVNRVFGAGASYRGPEKNKVPVSEWKY